MTSKHKLKVKNQSVIISLLGLNHKHRKYSNILTSMILTISWRQRGDQGLVVGFLTSWAVTKYISSITALQ